MKTPARARFGLSTLNAQLSTTVWDNPVLVKEFRTRMRGARAYSVLLVYVLLLTLVVGITYMNWYTQTTAAGVSHQAASSTGRLLYQILFSLQAGLVALITPAITAGALTIEREQQTYAMLATSGLRPTQIVWGKLLAAVAFVALLLTSSLPLVSLSFLLGGVSPGEVFGTYLSLTLSAFVFGSIGILCSASLRATAAATVTTYSAVILLFIITLMPGTIPGGELPFRSVNAAGAINHAVDQEAFFQSHLPSWLIGVTMNLLLGLLFANMAMTKLEYFDDRRPLAVRGLATALWTAYLLFLFGNVYGQSAASWPRETLVELLMFAFGLLLAVVPIFTTGEWEVSAAGEMGKGRGKRDTDMSEPDPDGNPEPLSPLPSPLSPFLRGMLPHAMFRAELPAGAPLVGFWMVIAGVIAIGGYGVTGRLHALPLDALPLFFTMAAVLAAFTALGNFLSLTVQDRRAAMVLAYLIVAALSLLPLFGFMTWEATGNSTIPHLSWQFLYLSPFLAFAELSQSHSSYWSGHPPMLLGQTPFWLVTGVIYVALAFLFFAFTFYRISRVKR